MCVCVYMSELLVGRETLSEFIQAEPSTGSLPKRFVHDNENSCQPAVREINRRVPR